MKGYFRNLKKKMEVKRYLENYVLVRQFLMKNGEGVNLKGIVENISWENVKQEYKEKVLKCLDAKDISGFSSLMFAATKEDLDMGALSIKAATDINKKDDSGYTALMYACRFNSGVEFVKMLLDNNACVNIATRDGKTAIDFARDNKNVEIMNLLCSKGKEPHEVVIGDMDITEVKLCGKGKESHDVILTVEKDLGIRDKNKTTNEVILPVEKDLGIKDKDKTTNEVILPVEKDLGIRDKDKTTNDVILTIK